jgi:hypothetical protein
MEQVDRLSQEVGRLTAELALAKKELGYFKNAPRYDNGANHHTLKIDDVPVEFAYYYEEGSKGAVDEPPYPAIVNVVAIYLNANWIDVEEIFTPVQIEGYNAQILGELE